MEEERLFVDSAVMGFLVYKDQWTPVVGTCTCKTLVCEREFENIDDLYVVPVVCDEVSSDMFLGKFRVRAAFSRKMVLFVPK